MSNEYNELRKNWRVRARSGSIHLIRSLCELRDLIVELPQSRAQFISDFAADYGKQASTVRDYLHIIGWYEYDEMVRWVEKGLRFDHFEKAQQYASAKQMTPDTLLDFAASEQMTVDAMISFALGEKDTNGAAARSFGRLYDRLITLRLSSWSDDTALRYAQWLKAGLEFFK